MCMGTRIVKLKAILQLPAYQSRRKQFLKFDEADTYILIDDKLLGFRKNYLSASEFFVKQIQQENRKIWLLDENINSFVFLKIIGCLYGLQYCFERSWETVIIYETVLLLKIKELITVIEQDFKNNFDEYEFFPLFSIAHKFNIDWLKQICKKQLQLFGFQQINFNRSVFIQCEQSVVQALISVYRQCYIHGNSRVKLMDKIRIKSALQYYCRMNNVKIEVTYLLIAFVDNVIMETDSEEISESETDHSKCKNDASTTIQKVSSLINSQDMTVTSLKSSDKSSKSLEVLRMQAEKDNTHSHSQQKLYQSSLNTKQKKNAKSNCIKQQQDPIKNISFSDHSQFMQDKFFQQKCDSNIVVGHKQRNRISQRENSRSERSDIRKYQRSISPPSSSDTPQFGQYLIKRKSGQHKYHLGNVRNMQKRVSLNL